MSARSSATEDDRPLIDLSDETVSLGADNKSLQPAQSGLSLFDALCTGSNAPRYGNIELPKPLLNDSPTRDPFDIPPSVRLQAADTHSLNGTWPRTDNSDSSWARGDNSRSRSDNSWLTTGSQAVNGHQRNSVGDFSRDDSFSSSHSVYYSLPPVEDGGWEGEVTNQHSASSSLTTSARTQIQRELERRLSASFASSSASAASADLPVRRGSETPTTLQTNFSQSNGAASGSDHSSVRDSSFQGGGGSASQNSFWNDQAGQNKAWPRGSSFGNSVPVLPKLPPPGSLKLHTVASGGASSSKQPDSKAEKAFDWLNDAISTLALSRAGNRPSPTSMANSGSKPGMAKEGGGGGDPEGGFTIPRSPPPRYDEVPRDEEGSDAECSTPSWQNVSKVSPGTSRPPMYDEVPEEPYFSQAPRYGNAAALDEAFPSAQMPAQYQQYACASEFSDDFDDDEFDDDFDDASPSKACDEAPPPLPPKDYQGEGDPEEGRGSPEKPYIFPVLQDGKQLSHTHYFLIPPKDRPTATATVKPFQVDSRPIGDDDEADDMSQADYQNINVAASHLSISSRDSSDGSSRTYQPQSSSPRRRRPVEERLRSSQGRSYSKSSSSNLSFSSPSKSISLHSHDDSRSSVSSYSDASSADFAPDGGNFGTVSPRERVAQVQSMVLGVTDEECHTALCHCHWDVRRAVRYLKVEQLFRMGIASRQHCETLLEALQWNLELASSVMLDEVRGRVQCESAV